MDVFSPIWFLVHKKPFEYFLYTYIASTQFFLYYNFLFKEKDTFLRLLYNKSLLLPVEWVFPSESPHNTYHHPPTHPPHILLFWKETLCTTGCLNNAENKGLMLQLRYKCNPKRTTHGSRRQLTKDGLTPLSYTLSTDGFFF